MLIIDTETTGLWENKSTRLDHQPECIEFCGLTLNPNTDHIIDVFDQLIRPTTPISADITRMNNINNEMVRNAPAFKTVAPDIRDLIERSEIVVAHNAAFDVGIIDLEFERLGQTKIAWPRIICTVEATVHIKGYRQSMASLYELLFNERFEGAHRARTDVEALARIVMELRKRNEI